MSGPSLFSAALRADTDHVVAFDRDGAERRWPDLLIAASQIAARVADARGERWAIDLDDTFEFAAALLGCWAARKTALLAPRALLTSAARSLAIDGVVGSGANEASTPRRVAFARLARTSVGTIDVEPSAALVLYTSGSTGEPKAVERRLQNVEAELAVLESSWGELLGGCRVYSTVSHRHVYGMLFRVLWPLVNRRPLATFDLEYPEQLLGGYAAGQALVSSPALLKRIGHLPAGAAAWRAVFSSGGLLPEAAAADALRVLGASPIEVFGSTETSGVAWRRQADRTCWTTLASVETRVSDDALLEVRSPFTGRAGWLRMGDVVQLRGDGIFELLGRGDHLAKIEDKRVSLAEIERHLVATSWVADAAAVAMEQGGRQYVAAVIKLSDAGKAELAKAGRRAFGDALKRELRTKVERVAVPRKLRYVEDIPVDTQGKRVPSALRALIG